MVTDQEQRLIDRAAAFAREHKKRIAIELTDTTIFLPENAPVSVFMAGSPGAGKTEASKELVALMELRPGCGKVLRIDPDDLRAFCPGYDGHNSWIYQAAVSILVDKILDRAFRQRQSFLLDGTLSQYERAKKNIDRCLSKGRAVQILYVYQDPLLAWEFVQARETEEGRQIPVESFVDQYFAARDAVNRLKRELGPNIKVDLLVKPHDASRRLYEAGIEQIDNYVSETYDRASLAEGLRKEQG